MLVFTLYSHSGEAAVLNQTKIMVYFLIFISAIFVNNIVLSQFLGICPFLGVSKKIDTALGMGAAVTFVLVLATIITYLLQMLLNQFGLGFLQTIVFILVIAALVQMIEIVLKKISPSLYQALGVFLPLITTNCCILGVAILVADGTNKLPVGADHNLLTGTVFAFATAIGFALALVIFAGMREQLSMNKVPKAMQGTPIALLTAGLLAMAFMGFSGVV